MDSQELDALIAEKIMNRTLPEAWADSSVGPSHGDPGGYRIGVRPYSSDIATAFTVVEKMRERGHDITIEAPANGGWHVSFQPRVFPNTAAGGPDLPDCICRAALNAINNPAQVDGELKG